MTSLVIFNQYYYELLTKLRMIAKKHKEHSSTARSVLDVIKDNYQEFDKISGDYLEFVKKNCSDDFWKEYRDLEKSNMDDWLKKDEIKSVNLFINISIGDITKLLRDNFLCHHFLSVFYIFRNDMTEDESVYILKILQCNETEFNLENKDYSDIIKRLNEIKNDNAANSSDTAFDNMGNLKNTTIGKIAKEIIDDVNIDKFKQTMNEEGDILKALANPENGLGELFSKVGNKVTSKISSGELSQEAIMQDAMKFASILPGMFANQQGGGGNSESGFNMADMMKMMAAMNMNNQGQGKKTKTAINKQGLKALAKREELRKKLANKNSSS